MGYTHYWSRSKHLQKSAFRKAAEDCRKVVEHMKAKHKLTIVYDFDTVDEPPLFSEHRVWFNGAGDDGHETFVVDQIAEEHPLIPVVGGVFNHFCKTAEKDYDGAVCACLIVFNHHFKNFYVSSDGDDKCLGWWQARHACQEALGYGQDFTLEFSNCRVLHSNGLTFWRRTGNSLQNQRVWSAQRTWDSPFAGVALKQSSGKAVYEVYAGGWTDAPLFTSRSYRKAQWWATVHFLRSEIIDGSSPQELHDFFTAAVDQGWVALKAAADWLQEQGIDIKAEKLRRYFPQVKETVPA